MRRNIEPGPTTFRGSTDSPQPVLAPSLALAGRDACEGLAVAFYFPPARRRAVCFAPLRPRCADVWGERPNEARPQEAERIADSLWLIV